MEKMKLVFVKTMELAAVADFNIFVYAGFDGYYLQVENFVSGITTARKYFPNLETAEQWFEDIPGKGVSKLLNAIKLLEEENPLHDGEPLAVEIVKRLHGTPETKGKRGLIVNVYKSFNRDGSVSDCTNGGLSGEYNEIFVLHPEGPFEENGKFPVFEYTPKGVHHAKLTPVYPGSKGRGFMYGGNLALCSDSRFSKLSGGEAVRIFDRLEF